MPEGHAEYFEVAFRQFIQNLGVDVILAKQALVLAETQAAQPIPDVHDRSPIGCCSRPRCHPRGRWTHPLRVGCFRSEIHE